MSRRKENAKTDKDTEVAAIGSSDVAGGGKSDNAAISLSDADKKYLVDAISDRLLPQLNGYIDQKFKELEPSKESTIGKSIMSAGAAAGASNAAAPDLSKIMDNPEIKKVIGMFTGGNNAIPPTEGTSIIPGAGDQPPAPGFNLGGIQGIMQLLQMFGVLPNQQQNSGGMMMELMQRAFMEDIAFGSTLKKLAISHMFKNPEAAAQFGALSDSFVGNPLQKTASLISGNGNGQQ